jgi:hypothetical protein
MREVREHGEREKFHYLECTYIGSRFSELSFLGLSILRNHSLDRLLRKSKSCFDVGPEGSALSMNGKVP